MSRADEIVECTCCDLLRKRIAEVEAERDARPEQVNITLAGMSTHSMNKAPNGPMRCSVQIINQGIVLEFDTHRIVRREAIPSNYVRTS